MGERGEGGAGRHDWGEFAVAGVVGLAGLFITTQTFGIAAVSSYAQVGPRFFPGVVGALLLVLAALLAREAATGGFRRVEGAPDQPASLVAFAWVTGAVVTHLALIGTLGFVIATVILFVGVARGIGSARPRRDALFALVLGIIIYGLFTYGLGLNLPAGPFVRFG